MKTGC